MTFDEIRTEFDRFIEFPDGSEKSHVTVTSAMLFAKHIADKERDACAKLAQETICDTHIPTGIAISGAKVAKLIRARSEK